MCIHTYIILGNLTTVAAVGRSETFQRDFNAKTPTDLRHTRPVFIYKYTG